MNQAHNIVAQDFRQSLIDHSRIGLRAQRVSEFPLNHAERGFHVAALVVVHQVLIPLVHEVVEHLLECSTSVTSGSSLERDKRSATSFKNSGSVLFAGISRICA